VSNVITIDGPVSSGKNSVGHLLSRKLGYQFIDTGSLYRVFSLYVLKNDLDINDPADLDTFKNIDVEFKNHDGHDEIFADGIKVTDKLHNPEVTAIVPEVAAIKRVREIAKLLQRKLGLSKNTVMTGRDIGSEIFPDARYKFYLTADLEIRAKRRFNQLVEVNPEITLDEVKVQIKERDKMDAEREVSPMRIPNGAIIVDSSGKSVEQTVEEMLSCIKEEHGS
jgi:CMP/dCMP kinase